MSKQDRNGLNYYPKQDILSYFIETPDADFTEQRISDSAVAYLDGAGHIIGFSVRGAANAVKTPSPTAEPDDLNDFLPIAKQDLIDCIWGGFRELCTIRRLLQELTSTRNRKPRKSAAKPTKAKKTAAKKKPRAKRR